MRCSAVPVLALALLSPMPAWAEPSTYVNARFGTSCTFPDEIFSRPQPEPDNSDGRLWLSEDGASLICSGIFTVTEETPKTYLAAEQASQGPGYTITYARTGKDWVALSGFKDGNVFYQRRLFGKDDVIRSVWIEYPPALKAKYDPLVGKIAGSLKGP